MHAKRLLVAFVFIPLLYLYIMYLPPYCYLFFLIVVSSVALAEFYLLAGVGGLLRHAGLACGALVLIAHFLLPAHFHTTLLFASVVMLAVRLFQKRDAAGSVREASAAVFGLLYVPGLLSVQLDIVKASAPLLIALFAAVWGGDSMALYVGKGIGKRKLYPEVSPNKTVAGAVACLCGGVIGTLLVKSAIAQSISFVQAVLLGTVVGLASIIGDLIESMFKRDAGIKDSSSIVPGHGGFLDKIDSATVAGPAFYWSCLLLGVIR